MRKKIVDTRRTASERRAARKKQHEPRDPTGQTDDEGHQSIRWHNEEQMDLLIQQLEQAREECKELQGKHARTKKIKRKRKKGCREDASEVSNSDARDGMENIELLNEVKSVDYGKAEMSKARKQHHWSKCPVRRISNHCWKVTEGTGRSSANTLLQNSGSQAHDCTEECCRQEQLDPHT